jgi:hypothetical protein
MPGSDQHGWQEFAAVVSQEDNHTCSCLLKGAYGASFADTLRTNTPAGSKKE